MSDAPLSRSLTITLTICATFLILGLAALAAGLRMTDVLSATRRDATMRQYPRSIDVRGTATRLNVQSDEASATFYLDANGPSLESATKNLEGKRVALVAALTKRGVKEEEISADPVYSSMMYDSPEQSKPTGGTASVAVRFTTKDMARAKDLAAFFETLVSDGILQNTPSLEYRLTTADALRRELLEAAMKDARDEADAIAASTKTAIGPLLSARTVAWQLVPYGQMVQPWTDYGPESGMPTENILLDTMSASKDAVLEVRASFDVATESGSRDD